MILKKPYAFLIKNFKIIHLILTICSIYLVIKINGMLNYYNSFIDGTIGKLAAVNFFGNIYLWVILLSIIICLIIIMLMKYKKKSYLFYIILIGYFLAVCLVMNYSIDGLYQIYVSSLEVKDLLLHRDVLKIVSIVQYVFVLMCLIRALGFDIKKFNFADDLMELNIDVSDDEEFELIVSGGEQYNRRFFRRIREFKYYYLENKYIINILIGLVLLVFLGSYLLNSYVFNPVYKVNDVFNYDDFSFKVLDTYVSNIGSDDKKVSSDGDTFVLIKVYVTNNFSPRNINKANLILEIGNKSYASNVITSKFNDLGIIYREQKVKESGTYLIAYRVLEDDVRNKMILNFGNDKKVSLSPIYLDKIEDVVNYKVGENLDVSNSILGFGNIKITSYEVLEKFNYAYTYEVLGQTYDGNITISSVNNVIMNLVMEGNYLFDYNNYSFLEKYGKLKYTIDGVEYVSNVFYDKTPGSYKNGIYVAVNKEIQNANSIWFDIVIRNKRYIYRLK